MTSIGGQGTSPSPEIPPEEKVKKVKNPPKVQPTKPDLMDLMAPLMRVPGAKVPTEPLKPLAEKRVTEINIDENEPPIETSAIFKETTVTEPPIEKSEQKESAIKRPTIQRIDSLMVSTGSFSAGKYEGLKQKDPLVPISKQLEKTVDMIIGYNEKNRDPDLEKMMLDKIKVIHRTAPDLIREKNHTLAKINKERIKLDENARDPAVQRRVKELNTEQEFIKRQLGPLYQSLTNLRESLQNNPQKAEIFKEAHVLLSGALEQKENVVDAPVQIPVQAVGKAGLIKGMIKNPYTRGKIQTVFKNIIFRPKSVPKEETNKIQEIAHEVTNNTREPAPNTAKAVAANALFAVGVDYAKMLFGKDLVSASRNVASREIVMEERDVDRSVQLKEIIQGSNLRLPGETTPPEIEEVKKHVYDGVCAGTSIEVLLQHTQKSHKNFVDISAVYARGVDVNAHANQMCYECMTVPLKLTTYRNAQVNQLPYVFDEKKGVGIFKANFEVINEAYMSIVEGQRNTRTPLSEAITKVLQNNRQLRQELAGTPGTYYINNTAKFREAVLNQMKLQGEVTEQQIHELDWVIALNEMYTGVYASLNMINPPDSIVSRNGPFNGDRDQFFSDERFGKTLDRLILDEMDFSKLQLLIRGRGADLEPVGKDIGISYAMRNDAEALDRASKLPDGHYMVGITLSGCGHALCYFKGKNSDGKPVEYLFDPNFGTIDCSNGRLKEQFTRLLTFDLYKPEKANDQGIYSDGTSHQIQFHRLVEDPAFKDLLPPVLFVFDKKK